MNQLVTIFKIPELRKKIFITLIFLAVYRIGYYVPLPMVDQVKLGEKLSTEEEILLRLRQLATGHRYSINFGVTYSFGSLSNATVNPRFGG